MISIVGNEPTYLNRVGKELIDMIVMCTRSVPDLIQGWHDSDEPSLSDHRHIMFEIPNFEQIGTCYRNPRRTVCDSFKVNLSIGCQLLEAGYAVFGTLISRWLISLK